MIWFCLAFWSYTLIAYYSFSSTLLLYHFALQCFHSFTILLQKAWTWRSSLETCLPKSPMSKMLVCPPVTARNSSWRCFHPSPAAISVKQWICVHYDESRETSRLPLHDINDMSFLEIHKPIYDQNSIYNLNMMTILSSVIVNSADYFKLHFRWWKVCWLWKRSSVKLFWMIIVTAK